jgi:hypothetical protein
VNNTADAMVWNRIVTDANILTVLDSAGWEINTSRGYVDESGWGFNTTRLPSITNDTAISFSATFTNTLLTTCTLNFQISADNITYVTIATLANLTEAVNSITLSANPTVPAGYYYRLATSGSGTITLINLQELSY